MEPISAFIAGLVVLVGIAVVCIGLFADRSRGRRRCAACGYAMDGLESHDDPLRCPECGRVAKSECALYRTRRRPRRVVAGVLLILLGGGIAGWSRWEAAGPAALPGPVLVRLTMLDRADTRDEIIRRIDEGLLEGGDLRVLTERLIEDTDHTDAARSAFAEKAIDRLVSWVARNQGATSADDRAFDFEPRRRIVASALGPRAADALLNDPDSARRREAMTRCELLASRSIAAQHALLAAASDPDPDIAEMSRWPVSRGDWLVDGLVPGEVSRQFGAGRMTWLRERIGPWVRERPGSPETMLTLAGHLLDPSREGAEFLEGYGETGVGAALLLSTLGPTEEVYQTILDLADSDAHGMEAMAPLRLLAAFEWRDEMGPVLIAAIAHENWEMQDTGWDVIEHFGGAARGLSDDLLAVIRRPAVDAERRAPRVAMELGVSRDALREAGLAVLRAQLEAWRRARTEPFEIDGYEIAFGGGVVDWIGTVTEPGDAEVVAVLRELVFETEPGLGCRVAFAYLRASGDGEGVTRFVLESYERAVDGEFDDEPRMTGSRVHGTMLSLLFDPGLDVDAVLAWIGDDEIRAGRLVHLLVGGARGSIRAESRESVERLAMALREFEPARDLADRMLTIIQRSRERDAEG